MKINGWKYYVHAAIPTLPPHIEVDETPVNDGSIWSLDGGPILVRWTSDWDCGYETNWWYCIKDTPFDISTLKSKRRYEINKGNKNFSVEEINPTKFSEDLFRVTSAAYETYPESYRPNIEHNSFIADVSNWKFIKVYGAFFTENKELSGYACLLKDGVYINFAVLKAVPEKEKLSVNAAIVNKILIDHEEFLKNGGYICDGSRSIQHETAFQDYLEKYFEFRKAYCRLHVIYKQPIKDVITIAYPFRKLLSKMDGIGPIKKVNALLKMEEINRSFK